jgi:ribonuclease BN (tRNA processing enzyme)
MRLKVLGCSGGIGGRHMRTTSFLIDGDVLLDAGTGVGDLTLAELSLVDHIFVTHSHLDHVSSIAFIADTVGGMRSKPILVHALPETIAILKNHIFNWEIWPDFTQIPTPEKPFMRYEEIALGRTVTLAGRAITPLPAIHTVPAVGYQLDSGQRPRVPARRVRDARPCASAIHLDRQHPSCDERRGIRDERSN